VSSAIAGLIGAGIGGLAGVAGAFISQYMLARATRQRALLGKKEEAYSSTLRYLRRVQNRRSGIAAGSSRTFVGDTKNWFDDLVEAQFWASTLTVYCSAGQKKKIEEVSQELNDRVADWVSGKNLPEAFQTEQDTHTLQVDRENGPVSDEFFERWQRTILACAREDIGESYAGRTSENFYSTHSGE
jgi:hypothetical protein